jgi:hypothetical protein
MACKLREQSLETATEVMLPEQQAVKAPELCRARAWRSTLSLSGVCSPLCCEVASSASAIVLVLCAKLCSAQHKYMQHNLDTSTTGQTTEIPTVSLFRMYNVLVPSTFSTLRTLRS